MGEYISAPPCVYGDNGESMKIAFAITSFGEVPFCIYQNHIQCMCHWTKKYDMILATSYGSTLLNARESCLDIARENDCSHIFYVDSDIALPLDALDSLISCNADLASGLATRRAWPFEHVAWMKSKTGIVQPHFDPNQPGIYPVEWVGGGCALFKVSAFDKLEKPYFRHVFEDGRQIYEDVYLCMKMREAGLFIVLDSRVQCGHMCRGQLMTPKQAEKVRKLYEKEYGQKK